MNTIISGDESAKSSLIWTSQVIDEIRFMYDDWNVVAQLNANLSPRRSFVWGLDLSGSLQGAGGVGGLLTIHDVVTEKFYFTAFDGNGNLVALFDSLNGTSTATYEYGPFGEALRITGVMSKANPFRYSTKYAGDETEVIYYGYRHYSPIAGRWLTRDPIEEHDTPNVYNFIYNYPTTGVDPTGLETFELVVMSFIEWPIITFLGDGHGIGTGGSFRTIHRILVETCGDDRGLVPNSEWKDTGITVKIDPSTGAVIRTGKASGKSLRAYVTKTPTGIVVGMEGNESDPLFYGFAPGVTYTVSATFNVKTGKATYRGKHDRFPSFEILIGPATHTFSHVAAGTGAGTLFPIFPRSNFSGRFNIEKCCITK